MPLTVITIKNAPNSLRGDLTKWMQEIATGVYVGNFNTRVREKIWERVQESVGHGEATISFAYRNEIGYQFDTLNSDRAVINYDGIPLVQLPNHEVVDSPVPSFGYSDAARFRKMKKYAHHSKKSAIQNHNYVVLDIETDGTDEYENVIIEIGAVKQTEGQLEKFHSLLKYEGVLPKQITMLTGISQSLLEEEGRELCEVLNDLVSFIGDLSIVGYGIHFDLKFLNQALKKESKPLLNHPVYDIMRFVKKEKLFLENYQLQTVLKAYGIDKRVPHRALEDAGLIWDLATKVNKFVDQMNRQT